MGSAIYVSNDGNWGSAEEGDLVILHNAKDADIENIDENTDSGRWEENHHYCYPECLRRDD